MMERPARSLASSSSHQPPPELSSREEDDPYKSRPRRHYLAVAGHAFRDGRYDAIGKVGFAVYSTVCSCRDKLYRFRRDGLTVQKELICDPENPSCGFDQTRNQPSDADYYGVLLRQTQIIADADISSKYLKILFSKDPTISTACIVFEALGRAFSIFSSKLQEWLPTVGDCQVYSKTFASDWLSSL